MKTPSEVSQERIAKAAEQFAKAMNELNKHLAEQNRLIALTLSRFTPAYRDIEVTEPVEKSE